MAHPQLRAVPTEHHSATVLARRRGFLLLHLVPENPAGKSYCGGGCPLSAGLDTGAEDLSSLKMPAILPKNPFFFLGSCTGLPSGPFAASVGGGSTFCPLPKMREKNPATPPP